MNTLKYTGLGIFLLAFATFLALPLATRYGIDGAALDTFVQTLLPEQQAPVSEALQTYAGQTTGKFRFMDLLAQARDRANADILAQQGMNEAQVATSLEAAGRLLTPGPDGVILSDSAYRAAVGAAPEAVRQTLQDWTGWLAGRSYPSEAAATEALGGEFRKAAAGYAARFALGDAKGFYMQALRAFGLGWFWQYKTLFFLLIVVVGSLGAVVYMFPAFFDGMPGIKHNGIYFSSATNRGLIGILVAAFLIGFYILLYFFPQYITEWIALADPVSMALKGEPSNQWFMYGFLYTVAIAVMGVRMFAKYRHSNYHKVRTASVIFFQVVFAFLLPQILYLLNLPEDDLKNAWPLNYYFFFDWNIQKHIDAGTFGIFLLIWSVVFSIIGVPVLTFFFGKRWYCSWVCGCGALAETLGDPYRQLSDKSVRAWHIERWLIHGVLVFAVVMTLAVLYTYLPAEGSWFDRQTFVVLVGALFVAGGLGLWFSGRKKVEKPLLYTILGVGAAIVGLMSYSHFASDSGHLFFMSSYDVRSAYGFAIGSIFAGVVGTGFYPVMGNRVWCRFGCPLAAYMGIVQRFQSRFRITTNGGQCISCGNCSTYCEQGIDVRAYAQRGQNIVRASCVGCGVCAAVCPRGVLALENGPDTGDSRLDRVIF
ncbi:MAG: hypothetical protein OHK0039_02280 [Bacteroidia bacterium]